MTRIPETPSSRLPRSFLLVIAMSLVVAMSLATAEGAEAQGSPTGPSDPAAPASRMGPRIFAGGGFWFADPRGEFGRYVDGGIGLDLNGRLHLDALGVVSLRGDLGFVQYGRESRHVCFAQPVGCRILLDLTTSNDILTGGIGPELAWPGHVLRPYVYGAFGFAYFSTRSSLRGSSDTEDFAETENYGDGTTAWVAGSGLQVRLSEGRHPVYIDFGVDHHANGEAEYLREGDIVDNEDGSITLFPTRSQTNFTTFRIGVSVGIPGGGNRRDPFPR